MAVGRQNAACEESQSFASRMALSGDCGQLIDGYARFRADCIRPRLFRLSPQTRSESGRTSAATRVFKRKQTRPKLRRAFCAHRPGPRRRPAPCSIEYWAPSRDPNSDCCPTRRSTYQGQVLLKADRKPVESARSIRSATRPFYGPRTGRLGNPTWATERKMSPHKEKCRPERRFHRTLMLRRAASTRIE